MLEEILKLNVGVALESLSVAGNILRNNARNSMKSKSVHWSTDYANGKKLIKKDASALKELGLRITASGVANPSSMANMITSYLMPKSLVVVVGGKHRTTTLTKYRDGKPAGTIRVKGVGKSTQAILHKLNFGEITEDYSRGNSEESIKGFKNAKYVGYHFMEEGYRNSTAAIADAMTIRYEKILGRAIDIANVQVRIIKVS